MAKTKKTQRSAQKLPISKIAKLSGVGLLVLFVVGQLVFDARMYTRQSESTPKIASLILMALQNSNKPAVIEPVSKKTYLPDASLVLPPTADLGDVRYQYAPANDNAAATMQITLANAQNTAASKILAASSDSHQEKVNLENMFAAVPQAQVCTRGLYVKFTATGTGFGELQFSKQLADGRTMQVYQENPGCGYSLQPLINALRDAESY